MKHIKLFEEFINEGLKAKKPNDVIEIDIDFAGSDSDLKKLSKKHKLEVDEYQPGMVLLKGKKKDILDYLQSYEYDMDPEDIKDLFPELLESDIVTIKMNRLNEEKFTYVDAIETAGEDLDENGIKAALNALNARSAKDIYIMVDTTEDDGEDLYDEVKKMKKISIDSPIYDTAYVGKFKGKNVVVFSDGEEFYAYTK